MIFAIVSSVIFFILGVIWNRDDFINLVIKLVFFGMAGWGLVASNAITLNV